MTATSKITAIATQLPRSKAPLEWAVSANGILFTAQIPIDASGQVVAGGIEAQARQTLENLKHTLECAGGGMPSLTQALIYVTDRAHLAAVNQVYAEYVSAPYPNRAAIIVSGFAREEMLVEIVAYAAT
ncbi:endoribonuclease [Marinobacter sp. CP1]|jgi:enamine deaminase RidA (YjgF/YER057c/UK114 family)|uniref:RidA family protein n=1 Tax=Marinobacter adhaerens TaxID=1033846 RepID=A0A352ITN7_9GAMM|nr:MULTISPECIES: RidA family protein [unclassified Marinobacter]AKV96665.1 endoribonuclease [Marinobacter sp. CP1]MAI33418.1 RidA family protein [Rhodopirellula sp.]HBC34820.1 RidA family protein [Marinobacter adhaerens]|tara:strand:- start:548 stop:934 length:387 start_codon:yes stop_codon:yes gene_type:complete